MSTDATNPVLRLEQALRHWEDSCYIKLEWNAYRRSLGRPLTYQADETLRLAPELRSKLLGAVSDPTEVIRFVEPAPEMNKALWNLAVLPLMLAAWTASSRRIFQVSPELQALLNATSLKGIRWSDVRLPFPSFVVTLPTPIISTDGRTFDCILVTNARMPTESAAGPGMLQRLARRLLVPAEPQSMLEFRLLPTTLGTTAPVSAFEREHIRKGKANKDSKKVWYWLKKLDDRRRACLHSTFAFCDDRVADVPVTDSLKSLYDKTMASACTCGKPHPEWDAAARIVVGICLYLSTLPSDRPTDERSEWKPGGNASKSPRVITTAAEVCLVSTSHRLDSGEREEFLRDRSEEAEGDGRTHREMSPHFRRGFWRRPKGQGQDPLAAKVQWVRPTLVRADRLPEGALPIGSATRI